MLLCSRVRAICARNETCRSSGEMQGENNFKKTSKTNCKLIFTGTYTSKCLRFFKKHPLPPQMKGSMEFMTMSQRYYLHSTDKESRGMEGFTITSTAKARHLKIQLGVQQRRVPSISANHVAKCSPMAFWALQSRSDLVQVTHHRSGSKSVAEPETKPQVSWLLALWSAPFIYQNIISRLQPPDRDVWQRQLRLCQTWACGRFGDTLIYPGWVTMTQGRGEMTGQTPVKDLAISG